MINLTEELKTYANENLKSFNKKIVNDTGYEILGVKIPQIRLLAKNTFKNKDIVEDFYKQKHIYLEEWLLHGFFIAREKNFEKVIELLNDFLPHIDSWLLTDCICASLKIFNKHRDITFSLTKTWLSSQKTYTKRFAIVVLLSYFAKKNDISDIISLTKNIKDDIYILNMAISWLYSVLFVYHKQEMLGLLQTKTLNPFVQNKTIQKINESKRIDEETKELVKQLVI